MLNIVRYNKSNNIYVFIVCVLFNTPVLAVDSIAVPNNIVEVQNTLKSWKFAPLIGARPVYLDVKRISDGSFGIMTNDDNNHENFSDILYVSLYLESPSWMFTHNAGVSIRSEAQSFNLTRQQVYSSTTQIGYDVLDVGTKVSGFYSYIGPTVFYDMRFADSIANVDRIGIGFVYWKTSFSGDIILAQGNRVAAGMPKTNINSVIDDTLGAIAYYQLLGDNFILELSISKLEFSNAEYVSKLEEVNLSLGILF